MFVKEEEVQSRLDSPNNLANKLGKGNRKNHENAGRKEGDVNLHPVVRSVIAVSAEFDTAKNVAEEFGVSPAAVHNYKHGKHTGTGNIEEDLVKAKKETVDNLYGKAASILMKTLNILDEEGVLKKDTKVTTLSSIAKDMSVIIKNTGEKEENKDTKVIIITAAPKEMKSYDVIEVESAVVE